MTPELRAAEICDGLKECICAPITEAIRAAVDAETERCAALAEKRAEAWQNVRDVFRTQETRETAVSCMVALRDFAASLRRKVSL